jgi:drug/metabolite transporter (DMT)-like permease
MKRLIKNLIIFFSLGGMMLFVYQIMGRGLGSKYDELGLALFVGIFLLILTTKEE